MRAMNEPHNTSPAPSSIWLPVLLLAGGLALRVMKLRLGADDSWPNVAPWMALAFTGSLVFPRAMSWWVWPLSLLIVDSVVQGPQALSILRETWIVYVCFAIAAIWGGSLRGKTGVLGGIARVIGCSVGFYIVTNTQSWLVMPEYAKTLGGWVQALTTGLPGFPPSILFLRNALLSDVCFSALLLLAYNAEALMRRVEMIPWMTRERVAA